MKKYPSDPAFNLYSTEELFAVLERISDAFVALDNDWCYTYMNRKAGEIFKREPSKMIGKHIWTEFPEGINQPFYKAYHRAMQLQQYIYLEEYYPPYNKWFENHIYPSPEGLTIYFRDITQRKMEEEQMRIDKARLLKAQEMGQLGYWELARNNDKIWGSEKACELFGFPPVAGEIPVNKIEALIADIDKVRQAGKSLIRERQNYEIEVQIFPANQQSPRIISAVGEIENDSLGNSNKIVGVVKDITEQKRIEMLDILEKEALEHYVQQHIPLEELITFLLNGIKKIHPDMLCSVLKAKDGKLYNWSSPHLPDTFNQKTEGTPIGMGNGSCGSAAFLREKVEVSDISGNPYWRKYKEIMKDFEMKSCWSYPIIDSKNQLLGTFAIYHNSIRTLTREEENSIDRVRKVLVYVIEKKLAENEAKLYRDRLELIFNSSNDVMFLVHLDKENVFRFSAINQSFMNVTGLAREAVEGKRVDEVIPEPSCSIVLANYRQAIEKRIPITWDEITPYPSGVKTGIVTISPVFNENTECMNLVGTVHDITERKQIEEEIKRANEELRAKNDMLHEKNQRMEEIAWLQSHKVRAPLARIMGLIDLVQLYKRKGEHTDDLLDLVFKSAIDLDNVIKDIVKKTIDSDTMASDS